MISPQFSIGPFTFHIYGFIIAISIYLGWTLAKRRAHLYKISHNFFDDPIIIVPLIFAVVGARLYHVLHFSSFYFKNPHQILAISSGGLGIWGALIGVIIGFWIIARVKKINLLSLLDLLAPSFLLGQAIGRIGNYINQEGFGPPTDLPWGVYIASENRPLQFLSSTHFHPTFFYEAAIDAIFFLLLLLLSNMSFPRPPQVSSSQKRGSRFSIRSRMTMEIPGRAFGLYLILYSAGRFIVEFWRIDTWTIGTIKTAHVLALITFIIGIFFFYRNNNLTNKKTRV